MIEPLNDLLSKATNLKSLQKVMDLHCVQYDPVTNEPIDLTGELMRVLNHTMK